MNFKVLSKQLEELITAGQTDRANGLLDSMDWEKIPREQIADFANFARRSGQVELAAKALAPLVRSQNKILGDPTTKEKAVYAAALARLGAVTEALTLLKGIDDETIP